MIKPALIVSAMLLAASAFARPTAAAPIGAVDCGRLRAAVVRVLNAQIEAVRAAERLQFEALRLRSAAAPAVAADEPPETPSDRPELLSDIADAIQHEVTLIADALSQDATEGLVRLLVETCGAGP